jgi:hypothetical protein
MILKGVVGKIERIPSFGGALESGTIDLKSSCRKNRENSLIWRSFRNRFPKFRMLRFH